MFDPEKQARIRSGEAFTTPSERSHAELDLLDVDELLRLRGEIDKRLPNLQSLDLEDEVTTLYLQAKLLFQRTADDENTPANQAAQTLNSCSAALQSLIKMRSDLRREDAFKRMEAALIESLQLLTEEAREAYFEQYTLLAKKHEVVS